MAERNPDRRPVLAALEGLGAERGSAVMVGDGRNDVLTARSARMAVVVVSYGYNGACGRNTLVPTLPSTTSPSC